MRLNGSDFASGRLKQPKRPTTPIITTPKAQPTAVGQTTHTTKAHDHDGGADDGDDEDTHLFRMNQKLTPKKTKSATRNPTNPTDRAPATLFNAKKSHLHFQQRHKPTSFQVTRSLNRRMYTQLFLHGANFSPSSEGTRARAFWPFGQVQSFAYRELAGWRSGQCHCHDVEMLSDF